MRHISILIIFGADRHSETKVGGNTEMPQPQAEIQREEAPEPVLAPAAYNEPVAEKVVPKTTKREAVKIAPVAEPIIVEEEPFIIEEEPVFYEEDEILIQAEEERWPKNRGKTYNELQRSDDIDDYPFSPSTDDYNFNESQ